MLISVIVPVYKVEPYLNRCVDSILGQTYHNLEVILVDDGSPDGSGAICDVYAQQDPRVRVIHKENGGLSSARNAGIDIARGEYFAFVDSDDWIEPDTYETMLGLAAKYDAKMVVGGRYDVNADTMERTVGLCPVKEEVITGEEMLGRVFLWDNVDSSACDKLFHRSLYRQVRYPMGVICEDVAVFYLLAELAEQVVLFPKPFYNYYHHGGTITTSSISQKTFHFQQHTAVIYPYVREHCPGIVPQAQYFRVRSLVHAITEVSKAEGADGETFRNQYRLCCRELRKHVPFLLTSPLLHSREKFTWTIMALGIYWPLRRLYYRMRS